MSRETGKVRVAPVEPQRFADTFGMRSRRAFNPSARKALARSVHSQSPTELRPGDAIQVVATGSS